MSDKLKPCPFCGGEAGIWTPHITLGDDDTDVDYLRPICIKCGIVKRMVRFTNHDRRSADFMRARAEAIAAWNTRTDDAELTRLRAENARFREALAKVATDIPVPLDMLPDHDQPNGWRTIAVERIDIANAALGDDT